MLSITIALKIAGYYPSNIAEMVRDECEMLEAGDVEDPQKAQRKLDVIMADSR